MTPEREHEYRSQSTAYEAARCPALRGRPVMTPQRRRVVDSRGEARRFLDDDTTVVSGTCAQIFPSGRNRTRVHDLDSPHPPCESRSSLCRRAGRHCCRTRRRRGRRVLLPFGCVRVSSQSLLTAVRGAAQRLRWAPRRWEWSRRPRWVVSWSGRSPGRADPGRFRATRPRSWCDRRRRRRRRWSTRDACPSGRRRRRRWR